MTARLPSRNRFSIPVCVAIAIGLLMSACGDDPVSSEQDPTPPTFTPETVAASLHATQRYGPPGYETTITASCVARGSNAGILQFYVRGGTNEDINYSVSSPVEDSISIVLPIHVTERTMVAMRCAGKSGEVIEDEVELLGYLPEIRVAAFPDISLREDTPADVFLPRDLFSYTESLEVFSVNSALPVQLLDWENEPYVQFRPNSGRHGTLPIRFTATNSFGTTEASFDVSILGVTDLTYHLRVAGTSSPATTSISWYENGSHLVGSANNPLYPASYQLDSLASGPVVILAGENSDVFFPIRRQFEVSGVDDIVLFTTLHQQQYCRSIFWQAGNPLEACREVVRETLFTPSVGDEGYRPYPRLASVTLLTKNPVTGESFDQEWLDAFDQLKNELAEQGVFLLSKAPDDVLDFQVLSDGTLSFPTGSWIYPRTDAEPTGVAFRTYREGNSDSNGFPAQSGVILSSSMALDTNSPMPPSDQLAVWAGTAAFAMGSGARWNALSLDDQRAFLKDVAARFRFDDRTDWSIPVGLSIDEVMVLPQ